jgi:hypothetical protein
MLSNAVDYDEIPEIVCRDCGVENCNLIHENFPRIKRTCYQLTIMQNEKVQIPSITI